MQSRKQRLQDCSRSQLAQRRQTKSYWRSRLKLPRAQPMSEHAAAPLRLRAGAACLLRRTCLTATSHAACAPTPRRLLQSTAFRPLTLKVACIHALVTVAFTSCTEKIKRLPASSGSRAGNSRPRSLQDGILRLALWFTGALHARVPRAAQAAQTHCLRVPMADASSLASRAAPAVDAQGRA